MSAPLERRRDLALSLAIPALLVVVALLQIVRAHGIDQSPWSGAGFGMFAQIDGETTRTVRGWVVDDGDPAVAAIPPDLETAGFELTVVPTEERARDLARRWHRALGLPDGATLRVEVWRLTIDERGPARLDVATERMLRVEVGS